MNALQNSLATSSAPFQGMSQKQVQMAITYALQQIAKDTHTPNQLAALAACFGCLSDFEVTLTKTYLLWQVAGGATAPVVDPDVAAFITCSGITNPTQISAITALVASLKSASLWNSFDAIYPFVGGNATAHSCNLRNTSKFSIGWHGGVTHNANGVTGDGSTGYGDTGLNPATAGGNYSLNSCSIGVYSKTSVWTTGNNAIGAGDSSSNNTWLTANSATKLDGLINASGNNAVFQTVANYLGNIAIVRTDTLHDVLYGPGGTTTVGSSVSAIPSLNLYVLASNLSGAPLLFDAVNLAFAFVAGSFTGAQIATLQPIITTYQTALGRA